VASYHYIDDERLACAYIRYYQDSRSRMRIVQDLLKKGISKDTIEACMEAEYTTDETDMIRTLLEKKHYDRQTATREEQAKMYRFLMQRGFRSSDISRVLSE
jgi:regulatory protein